MPHVLYTLRRESQSKGESEPSVRGARARGQPSPTPLRCRRRITATPNPNDRGCLARHDGHQIQSVSPLLQTPTDGACTHRHAWTRTGMSNRMAPSSATTISEYYLTLLKQPDILQPQQLTGGAMRSFAARILIASGCLWSGFKWASFIYACTLQSRRPGCPSFSVFCGSAGWRWS